MNGPIVSVAGELGFEGDPILGVVVSIFIAGEFIGSISCGSLIDKFGCRRTFQVDSIPIILGAFISAQAHSLNEILLGRFLVGLGIGVNTVLPIYISEVAPTKYRGSLGTLNSTSTCLRIIVSLLLGIPSETDPHCWHHLLVHDFMLTFSNANKYQKLELNMYKNLIVPIDLREKRYKKQSNTSMF